MIGDDELSRDLAGLVVPQAGRLVGPVIVMSTAGWSTVTGWPWRLSRLTSGIFWRRAGRSPRSVLMGWIFFAGSGSCGRRGWPGIGRPASMPAISAGGCRSPVSSRGRIGVPAGRVVRWWPFRLAGRTRRRCVRIRRRCCGLFMTSIWMRAAGRSSTRSRSTGPGGAGGRTRTTIRWSPSVTSAAGFTGRGCPAGPAQYPGRRVQRDLRGVAVAPGPGAGRLLCVDRGAGL